MKESIMAYSKQKCLVKKALMLAGFIEIKVSNGYYYFSGFAEKNGKLIYFSISDVRHFPKERLLLRTATDRKDYTGGPNNYAELNNDDINRIANRLIR